MPPPCHTAATAKDLQALSYGAVGYTCKYRDGDAEDLSVSEVIARMFAGFQCMAALPKDDSMSGVFRPRTGGNDAKVYFGGTADEHEGHYQHESVIRTSNAMVFWLLDQGRLAELECTILDDERWVGTTDLEKLSRSDLW